MRYTYLFYIFLKLLFETVFDHHLWIYRSIGKLAENEETESGLRNYCQNNEWYGLEISGTVIQ